MYFCRCKLYNLHGESRHAKAEILYKFMLISILPVNIFNAANVVIITIPVMCIYVRIPYQCAQFTIDGKTEKPYPFIRKYVL